MASKNDGLVLDDVKGDATIPATKIKYPFSATIWRDSASGGWHFIFLPWDLSTGIRENLKWQEEGWGRLKAKAQIGNTKWATAIWFDTKLDTYILPLKAEIRRKEQLAKGQHAQVLV